MGMATLQKIRLLGYACNDPEGKKGGMKAGIWREGQILSGIAPAFIPCISGCRYQDRPLHAYWLYRHRGIDGLAFSSPTSRTVDAAIGRW